ncbi:hypothetical protein BDZ89DRAFT_1083720 [Hymenopellis radicata]|nr:hypothetical protein BDZ89DRAFT_1083720 [Hymenopellis radicata]
MPGNRLALSRMHATPRSGSRFSSPPSAIILLASPSLPRLHLPRVCESCWFRWLGIDCCRLRERATPRSGSRPSSPPPAIFWPPFPLCRASIYLVLMDPTILDAWESIPAGFGPARVLVPAQVRHLILLPYSTHIF